MPDSFDGVRSLWPGADSGDRMRGMVRSALVRSLRSFIRIEFGSSGNPWWLRGRGADCWSL